MGLENNHYGAAGEDFVSCQLKNIGLQTSKPGPDVDGVDLLCTSWSEEPAYRSVVFRVQSKRNAIHLLSAKVRRALIEQSYENPCFVMSSVGTYPHQSLWVCNLFDWICQRPSWEQRDADFFTIGLSYFHEVNDLDDLRRLLKTDAARVTGSGRSIWTPSQNPAYFISAREMFRSFGRLGRLEPPIKVIQQVAEAIDLADHISLQTALTALRHGDESAMSDSITSDQAVRDWIRIVSEPIDPMDRRLEVREFRRFAGAVDAFNKGEFFDLPDYTWRAVSAWRVFVSIFPRSFGLIECALTHGAHWTSNGHSAGWSHRQIAAAFGIASATSFLPDAAVSGNARALLTKLKRAVGQPAESKDQAHYDFLHQYHWSVASVDEDFRRPTEIFIKDVGIPGGRERLLHRRYYGCADDSTFASVLQSKLAAPKRRDELIQELQIVQLGIVQESGEFRAI